MAIKCKVINGVGLIKVRGTLVGGEETTEVHDSVKRMVGDDVRSIVIDLYRVKWMNSHGIGMIMGCYSTVQNAKGTLVLSRLSGKVEEIMGMTKVNRLFDIYENVHQALKALV